MLVALDREIPPEQANLVVAECHECHAALLPVPGSRAGPVKFGEDPGCL
jgi:hypothetical protein